MTRTRSISLGKFEKNSLKEDSSVARRDMIAVSDGAGGGGLFADRWSRYLVQHLPKTPITTAEHLDEWIGAIWETYYNKSEISAKKLGGLALDKFYDEGSFATLAAAWISDFDYCYWMTYGDSVVFHYDYATKKLTHSFSTLADFSNAPYLINCKDELNLDGFHHGEFPFTKDSFVFITSDALAHYVMMMYAISIKAEKEIAEAVNKGSKNSNLLKTALSVPVKNFEGEVIEKIRKAVYDKGLFKKWTHKLYQQGILGLDDYSLAVMYT